MTASVMAGMFMAAIEATIVATAMPTIVASLGGFEYFTWVFSAYLVAQAAAAPIYGRVADLYGRRPVFAAGVALFLTGSLLSGMARSMGALIAFRTLQGLGAACIMPVAQTIIGDLYRLEERARIQGYLSSVWGIAAVIGPAAGALIVQRLGWPWVFFINLPVGVAATAGLLLSLQESVERRPHRIDLAGSALLMLAATALLAALLEGGSSWGWTSAPTLGLVALAGAGFWSFWARERVEPEPVLPMDVLRQPVVGASNAVILVAGALTMAVSSFVPTFVQGVLGRGPGEAGFALAALSIGWPLASSVSGFAMLRFGFRRTAVAGSLLTVVSAAMFVAAAEHGPATVGQVAASSFVMGLGMGLLSTSAIVMIQEAVPWQQRGVATSSNTFMRLIGGALGVAGLGGILNATLRAALGPSGIAAVNALLGGAVSPGPGGAGAASPGLATVPLSEVPLRAALSLGLGRVYTAALVLAVAGVVLATRFPHRVRRGDLGVAGTATPPP